jgi:hypothetical protein
MLTEMSNDVIMNKVTHVIAEGVYEEIAVSTRYVDLDLIKQELDTAYANWRHDLVVRRGYSIARIINAYRQTAGITHRSLVDLAWRLMREQLWPREWYTCGPERSSLSIEDWLGQATSALIFYLMDEAGTFPVLDATDEELQAFLDERNPPQQLSFL